MPAASRQDARLVFIGSDKAICSDLPKEILLNEVKNGSPFVVGRNASQCDVVVNSPFLPLLMSNRHAEFSFDAELESWKVKDLGSTNKLYLDKEIVPYAVLKDGDKISFGPPTRRQNSDGTGNFLYRYEACSKRRLPDISPNESGLPASKFGRQVPAALSLGSIEHMDDQAHFPCASPLVVQVLDLTYRQKLGRWKMTLSDGEKQVGALAAGTFNDSFKTDPLEAKSIIEVSDFVSRDGRTPLLIIGYTVVSGPCPVIGSPVPLRAEQSAPSTEHRDDEAWETSADRKSQQQAEQQQVHQMPSPASTAPDCCAAAIQPAAAKTAGAAAPATEAKKRKRVGLPRSDSEVLEWMSVTLDCGSCGTLPDGDRDKFLARVEKEMIDAEVVETLSEEDLREFGLSATGNRRKLLNRIKEAFAAADTPVQTRMRLAEGAVMDPEEDSEVRTRAADGSSKHDEQHPYRPGDSAQPRAAIMKDARESDDDDDDEPIITHEEFASLSAAPAVVVKCEVKWMPEAEGSPEGGASANLSAGGASGAAMPVEEETNADLRRKEGGSAAEGNVEGQEAGAGRESQAGGSWSQRSQNSVPETMPYTGSVLPETMPYSGSVMPHAQASANHVENPMQSTSQAEGDGASCAKGEEALRREAGREEGALGEGNGERDTQESRQTAAPCHGTAPTVPQPGSEGGEKGLQTGGQHEEGAGRVLRAGSSVGETAGGDGEGRQKGEWWAVGRSVEVLFEEEYWKARVKEVRPAAVQEDVSILIAYMGGTDEEDEWLRLGDGRARAPTVSWNEGEGRGAGGERGVGKGPAREGSPSMGRTRSSQFQVGDHVLGRYQNGSWYSAVITGREGERFVLKWDDGDAKDRHKTRRDLRHFVPDAKFQVGDSVQGFYKKTGGFYSAEIVDFDGTHYKIRWDDGDKFDTLKTESELREKKTATHSAAPKGCGGSTRSMHKATDTAKAKTGDDLQSAAADETARTAVGERQFAEVGRQPDRTTPGSPPRQLACNLEPTQSDSAPRAECEAMGRGGESCSTTDGQDEQTEAEEEDEEEEAAGTGEGEVPEGCAAHHPGELEVDCDAEVWADHDEDCHGAIDTRSMRRSFPEGFAWSCCGAAGDAQGCTRGAGASIADKYPSDAEAGDREHADDDDGEASPSLEF